MAIERDILKLSRTYEFEDQEVDELDFTDFEDNVTVDDMMGALDTLARSGRTVVDPEMDVQYCLYIAACATRMPHEFFRILKPSDVVKVKNKVRKNFFV